MIENYIFDNCLFDINSSTYSQTLGDQFHRQLKYRSCLGHLVGRYRLKAGDICYFWREQIISIYISISQCLFYSTFDDKLEISKEPPSYNWKNPIGATDRAGLQMQKSCSKEVKNINN